MIHYVCTLRVDGSVKEGTCVSIWDTINPVDRLSPHFCGDDLFGWGMGTILVPSGECRLRYFVSPLSIYDRGYSTVHGGCKRLCIMCTVQKNCYTELRLLLVGVYGYPLWRFETDTYIHTYT